MNEADYILAREIQKAADYTSKVVNETLRETEAAIRDVAVMTAPLLRGPEVVGRINQWNKHIEATAPSHSDASVMRAIVFEEQVHEWPPFLEFTAESLGFFDSVGPSQIRVSMWAEKYDTKREELLDPETHFETMSKHLDFVKAEARRRGLAETPDMIGSLWNNMDAEGVTEYGERVESYTEFLDVIFPPTDNPVNDDSTVNPPDGDGGTGNGEGNNGSGGDGGGEGSDGSPS